MRIRKLFSRRLFTDVIRGSASIRAIEKVQSTARQDSQERKLSVKSTAARPTMTAVDIRNEVIQRGSHLTDPTPLVEFDRDAPCGAHRDDGIS